MGTLFAKSPVSNEMKKVNPFIGYALEEEPAEWREMRENLHTNPDDQFFLLRSGAIDGITFINCKNHTLYLYGGENGNTLLYQTTITTTSFAMRSYFLLSDFKGRKYTDKNGVEYELFGIVLKLENGVASAGCSGPGYSQSNELYVPLLEYAGNSLQVNMFGGQERDFQCPYLEYVFLGNKVTNIPNYAFYETYNLKNIEIKHTNPISIGNYAFNYSGIKYLDLIASSVGSFAFAYSNIEYLKIKITNDSSILSSFVYQCSKLITLIIDTTEINSASIQGYAFSDCRSLTRFRIPDNVTFENLLVNNPFSQCYSLRELIYNGNSTLSFNLSGPSLELINLHTLVVPGSMNWYGYNNYRTVRGLIGTKGTIPGTSSPTLGLETPILIDFENSFTLTKPKINFRNCCLTLDMLKAIFDYLPVVTNGSFMCGYQNFQNESGVWTNGNNQIYTQFLAWFNTLTTEQKKGWSVATG